MTIIGNYEYKRVLSLLFLEKKNMVLRCEAIKSKKFADTTDKDLIVWVG